MQELPPMHQLAAVATAFTVAASAAAALPRANPAVVRAALPAAAVQVKTTCKNVCTQWEKCPPPTQPQPRGCVVTIASHKKFLKAHCVNSKKVCLGPAQPSIRSDQPPSRLHRHAMPQQRHSSTPVPIGTPRAGAPVATRR
jgi:hypothetical protein